MSEFTYDGETAGERYMRQAVMGAGIVVCGVVFLIGVALAVSAVYVGRPGYVAFGLALAAGHAWTVYSMAKHGLGLDAGSCGPGGSFRRGGRRAGWRRPCSASRGNWS